MVCSRRSSMSSSVRSSTSSSTAVSGSMPSRLSLCRSCFSCSCLCSPDMPSSERAISLYLDISVLCCQSSLLFLSPYWPSRRSSDCRMSVRHGNLGVAYFLRCFFGSPILRWGSFAFD